MQVKVLTVAEAFTDYADIVSQKLESAGLRVETDFRNEKIGYKLREARNQRVNYILIIGEREKESNTATVRSAKIGELGEMKIDELCQKLSAEVANKDI